MPFDQDGRHVPDANMCAKFLRAHAVYLNTAKVEHPYVNSARAICDINNAAADFLDGTGAVRLAQRNENEKLAIALYGLVGRWEKNGGVVEQEFIDRARAALSF